MFSSACLFKPSCCLMRASYSIFSWTNKIHRWLQRIKKMSLHKFEKNYSKNEKTEIIIDYIAEIIIDYITIVEKKWGHCPCLSTSSVSRSGSSSDDALMSFLCLKNHSKQAHLVWWGFKNPLGLLSILRDFFGGFVFARDFLKSFFRDFQVFLWTFSVCTRFSTVIHPST